MLGISTSWKSTELDNGEALYQAIRRLPVSQIELEYRITDPMFHQLRGLLKKSDIEVVSIHNFFPLPPIVPRSMASGDLFLLSSPDRDERERAIRWSMRTIECANDLEARAVVLHCGLIEMEAEMETIYRYHERDMIDSDEAQEFIRAKLSEREAKKAKHLDALLFSLEKLAKTAEAENIALGLENRYSYFELPGPNELELLFKELDGAPIGYWHDVGHARVNEALSIVSQDEMLKKYADRLLGMHLHDVEGRNDHLPPGKGSIDFAAIKSHMKEETICILELEPGTPDAQVEEGIRFLQSAGIGRESEKT